MRILSKPALAAAMAAAIQTTAQAADLRAPYSPPQNDEYPVELGTGWYIRGDIGAASNNPLQFGTTTLRSMLPKSLNGWSAGIGAGYKFNNWFRADFTADYRSPIANQGFIAQRSCTIALDPVKAPDPITGLPTGAIIGSTPVDTVCTGLERTRLNRTHLLANAYVDLGTWSGITPYVGAGIGANIIFNKAQLNWFQPNGQPYNVTFTDPFSGTTFNKFMDQSTSGYSVQLAWALMAGVAIDLTPHVKLDLGYRFLSLGSYPTVDSAGNVVKKPMRAQEVRAGIRYTID
ncbi:MAG: outer membrane beta-barrel protein [Beijerinckiaceae bacterium]